MDKKEYRKLYYRRNKGKELANAKRSRKTRVAKQKSFVNFLKAAPCQDCGNTFPPECMDFDHVRGDKTTEVSALLGFASLERLQLEIAKCDLVCANCHR